MGHTGSQPKAGGGGTHPAPQGAEILGIELVEDGGERARIGSARQGKATHTFEAGKVFKEDLHKARDGDVALRTPHTDAVIGVVLHGKGDVAHVDSCRLLSMI